MTILVGTASWTDRTLIASKLFYPKKGCSSAEGRLRFYATQFPLVEVDSSYYAMPSEKNSELWVERTPATFAFNVKAFRILTGHQTPLQAFPKDIAEELAPSFAGKRNVYYADLPESVRTVVWDRFIRALEPLRSAGKLKAVLFQLAPWVLPSMEWKRHIEECVGRLAGFQVAIEFRNRAWYSDASTAQQTLEFERSLDVAHVVVDEPQVGKKSIPSVWAGASKRLAIVRLHGRNDAMWDAKGLSAASDRFNYDYSNDELAELSTPIRTLAEAVDVLHVIFNNNFEDQGVRNGRSMQALLAGERLPTG